VSASPANGHDMHPRTGTAGARGGSGDASDTSDASDGSCDSTMNEELGVYYDSLNYAKRFELRQCKRMQRCI